MRWKWHMMLATAALGAWVAHLAAAPDVRAQATAAPPSPQLQPPKLVDAPTPAYPKDAEGKGHPPTVILHATIGASGVVEAVHVDDSAGDAFDRAAVDAVKRWRFEPAKRDGVPVASTVRLAVHFALPAFDLTGHESHILSATTDSTEAGHGVHSAQATAEPDVATPSKADGAFEARAEVDAASLRPQARASSDYVIERDVLEAAPHRDAGELLQTAPGLYVARVEGEAVAQHITLRGFDAEHGQDIALSVAGVPVNQPSHIHGQGYADLGFIIPEVVRYVRVTEGVYDPRQGDFAVAGSADFDLGVAQRGVQLKATYGSFNTSRQLALWAPSGESEQTFFAVAHRKTDGFGHNRQGESGAALGQYVLRWGGWQTRLHSALYAARSGLAGVVRRDDIDSGRIGFYDAYRDATAQNQNAMSVRGQFSATAEKTAKDGSLTSFSTWLSYTDFRLQENFTGYLQRSQTNPEFVGRGDLIEQLNEAFALGLASRYRTPQYAPVHWAQGALEVGVAGRLDRISQKQNLLQAPQNETWDNRVDAAVQGADLGGYADLDWRFVERVRVRGGFRADVLAYQVDDKLGNFIPLFRRDSYIVGFRRSAMGMAAGPRASVDVELTPWLNALAAYGEGYRSPQARTLQDGETAPFTKVRSGDLGLRARFGAHDELTLATSFFATHLSDDIAFDPAEGRAERVGPTTRLGGVVHALAKPLPWLTGSASLTYVRATLDEPPPASAENPTPIFSKGALLPYVPPIVGRLDLSAQHALATMQGAPLSGRLGTGISYLSPRPLPFGQDAAPVALTDASAAVTWRALQLDLSIFNLFDAHYAATEYAFVSNWNTGAPPSRLPARHVAAGAPRTFLVSLGVQL